MANIRKTILNVDIDTFFDDECKEIVKEIQNAAAEKTAKETLTRNSFPLRPSSALKGARDLYYALENWAKPGTIPTTPIEGRSCILLSLGHAIERHLVGHIKARYDVPITNQRVTYGEIVKADGSKINLDGELDFVIKLDNGELVVCDSKSSAAFPFKMELPKDEHVVQINLYLHSQWAIDNRIKRAFIFYYNKDTSDIKVTSFYYDRQLAEATLARFQRIFTMWEKNKLPPREHILGVDWQAKYSAYRDYEWSEFEKPVLDRGLIKLSKSESARLPTDKKELLGFIVKLAGTDIVETDDGRRLWAVKKGDNMFLNVVDEDGFS
jgi:hypothetical protein